MAAEQGSSSSMVVLGLACGLATACLVGGTAGGILAVKVRDKARAGWNLVPVVVAAVDVGPGTEVTIEMVSQRSLPEQYVTSSVVKPDSVSYILNQRLRAPALAGDMLLWSSFEADDDERACAALVTKTAAAHKERSPELTRLVDTLQQTLGAPPP